MRHLLLLRRGNANITAKPSPDGQRRLQQTDHIFVTCSTLTGRFQRGGALIGPWWGECTPGGRDEPAPGRTWWVDGISEHEHCAPPACRLESPGYSALEMNFPGRAPAIDPRWCRQPWAIRALTGTGWRVNFRCIGSKHTTNCPSSSMPIRKTAGSCTGIFEGAQIRFKFSSGGFHQKLAMGLTTTIRRRDRHIHSRPSGITGGVKPGNR